MNWNLNLPTGTRDKLFREAEAAHKLENTVLDFFKKRDFMRIETPIIEFEDVFSSETKETHYRFFDEKGRLLALRPDMTLPIGRVVHTTGVHLPLKLSYSGKIFRANAGFSGDRNEETQAGIELIGYGSKKAEIECLLSGIRLMQTLAIPDFQMELGHAGFYELLVQKLHLSGQAENEFRALLQNKSLSEMQAFSEQFEPKWARFLCALPRLFGEVHPTILEAKALLPDEELNAPLDEILEMAALIQQVEPNAALLVDIGLVQELRYYTGLIFRGFASFAADYFLSGGRYDRLSEHFGQTKVPAVGLALHLDSILAVKERHGLTEKFSKKEILIHYDVTELKMAERYYAEHPESVLSFLDSERESIAFARKWDIGTVVSFQKEGLKVIFERGERV